MSGSVYTAKNARVRTAWRRASRKDTLSTQAPGQSIWDELRSFEQALRKGAARARLEAKDPDLANIFTSVGRRRRSRGETPQIQPGKPATAQSAGRGDAGTLLDITRIGTSVAILRIGRPAGMQFRAGQHLKLLFPNGAKNPYTIASAPSDPYLEFCIERVPGGRVSSMLFDLKPGAHVQVDAKPKGSFVLQPSADLHLMFATVTGISAFRSMLREAAAQNRWSRCVVVHGASFAEELVYREELEALAKAHPQHLRYIPSCSRPTDPRNRGFNGMTGRLPALAPALIRELQASSKRIQIYACGHPEMVQAIHVLGVEVGLPVASEVFD
jgi:ferredoxin-NADP reductase